MKKKQRKIWSTISWFLLPILWMGVIFLLSDQSVLPGPKIFLGDFLFKKGAHMFFFATLYMLWHLSLRRFEENTGKKIKAKWLWALILVFLFSLTDEYHQSFVPGRTATVRDIAFDNLGSLLAMLWVYKII